MSVKAISLFEALKNKTAKKSQLPKVAEVVDVAHLKKFSNLSDGLKREVVKTASALGCQKDAIDDMVSIINKGQEIQKQATYIQWLKDIHS